MGKAIYCPKGRASEYSKYACNFYNGCSADCSYCYCKQGILKSVWGITPTLKKTLIDPETAYNIFKREALIHELELRQHGLFFNFNSDPFLHETIELNIKAMKFCWDMNIPVKALTKQVWWINQYEIPSNVSIGFTLTGHDELELGAASNFARINTMEYFHGQGYKIWASIEPVIDIKSSLKMIESITDRCDHYKIGLLSGKRFDQKDLQRFIRAAMNRVAVNSTVYWKDELLCQAGITRDELPPGCVDRDYRWWV